MNIEMEDKGKIKFTVKSVISLQDKKYSHEVISSRPMTAGESYTAEETFQNLFKTLVQRLSTARELLKRGEYIGVEAQIDSALGEIRYRHGDDH